MVEMSQEVVEKPLLVNHCKSRVQFSHLLEMTRRLGEI